MRSQKSSFQREVFERAMKHELLVLSIDDSLFHTIISDLITLIIQMLQIYTNLHEHHGSYWSSNLSILSKKRREIDQHFAICYSFRSPHYVTPYMNNLNEY
jgi:hypothetical protein